MKWLFFAIFLPFTAQASQTEGAYYDRFQRIAAEHREEIRKEGFSYMLGGGIAFGTSLAFGVQSKEVLPKVGYSLIQTLGAAAFYYGALAYYEGDKLTSEANRLAALEETMKKNPRISERDRRTVLDELTLKAFQRERERMERTRKIRGYVALSTAVSSGLTMALSKSDSTASNISLGFILLVSAVGATSDLLLPSKATKVKELFSFSPLIEPKRLGASVAWRW